MDKARELGQLRHAQHASAHQLLHEYEILGEILETFLVEETERLQPQPSVAECFDVHRRLTRAVRVLMRTTVDTFIGEYTSTIQEQNERLKAFNRAASHELRSPIGTLRFAAALLDHEAVRHDPPRLAKVAATVKSSTDRLAWLIENLQRIARMEDPLDVPSEQRVDLSALADEVAPAAGGHGAGPARRHPRSRRICRRWSPTRPASNSILLNLVANAIKYSDPPKSRAVRRDRGGASRA